MCKVARAALQYLCPCDKDNRIFNSQGMKFTCFYLNCVILVPVRNVPRILLFIPLHENYISIKNSSVNLNEIIVLKGFFRSWCSSLSLLCELPLRTMKEYSECVHTTPKDPRSISCSTIGLQSCFCLSLEL